MLRDNVAPFVTKLSRLDACEDGKVVCWCRMQASSHNSQGIVDGRVNDTCGTRQEHSTLLLSGPGLRWLLATLQQHPSPSQQATPRVWRMMSTFCKKWLKVLALRERPVQHYSEVFGLKTKGQGFIVVVEF